MMLFTKPADQDRFNATVYDLIHLRFNGAVCIDGEWDAYDSLAYLEQRMGVEIIPTLRVDGSLFHLRHKFILFLDDRVVVTTSLSILNEEIC